MDGTECYICYEKATTLSPCVCQHPVHNKCLAKARRKGFTKCGICQDDLRFFEWTPVYLRMRACTTKECNEEFFRSAMYIGLLYYMTQDMLSAGIYWLGICSCVYLMRWREVIQQNRFA